MISAERATLAELNSVYSLEDLYDLLEIILVDQHNERVITKWNEKRDGDRNR